MIGSDHNLDFLKCVKHKATDEFISALSEQGYVPTILKPTRVTHQSSTLIDNIFIKGVSVFNYDSFVLVDELSDHYPCVLRLENKVKTKHCNRFITKRKLNDDVYFKLNQRLLFHDWSEMYGKDIDDMYLYLVRTINDNLDDISPKKEILISEGEYFREPWMNVKLCKLNSKCRRLFKVPVQTKSKSRHDKYHEYRKVLNRLKQYEKCALYNDLFKKIGTDTKSLCSVLNSLVKRTHNKSNSIELIVAQTKVTDPESICNHLNEHFARAGPRVQATPSQKDPLDYVKRDNNELLLGTVSETEICKIIERIKSKYSWY